MDLPARDLRPPDEGKNMNPRYRIVAIGNGRFMAERRGWMFWTPLGSQCGIDGETKEQAARRIEADAECRSILDHQIGAAGKVVAVFDERGKEIAHA